MPHRARAGRAIRKILPLVALAVFSMLVSLTYFWFVNPPAVGVDAVQEADAVVVFVGSEDRIDTAVDLMERGAAGSLVIPNGRSADMEEDLCDEASFPVFCPDTGTIDTRGEAQTIGRLADERGWSRLIAVTSVYHVYRATLQLRSCHEGPVDAVLASRDLDTDEWVEKIVHEWAGTLAALTVDQAC